MRNSWGRRLSTLVAGVLALSGLSVLSSSPARAADWIGRPTLLSGTAAYDEGEWVYTDFVFDDYGADTQPGGQPNVVSLAPTDGDFRYPDGNDFRDNAADVVEVRARVIPQTDDLEVRVLLNTLVNPDVVAIWAEAGELERVVTVHDEDAAIDAAANTVTFTMPGVAGGDSVRLNVGAGLHDGDRGLRAGLPGTASMRPNDVTTGAPSDNRLFDLAFNPRDIEPRGGAWNEERQSDLLAEATVDALAPAAKTLDLSLMRAGLSKFEPLVPGYYVRLFESRLGIDEGMRGSFPQYGGKWQPYALWIPDSYTASEPNPLILNMHSLSVHHNQYRGGTSPTYATQYEQWGDGLDAVVVTPLGRGPDGWYTDEGLVDTLEVWADVQRHYSIDRERTLVTGYSMGGYGTYRLTTLMPDAFASAVSVVGPPANGVWAYPASAPGGWTYPQLEATKNIPFWITHGVLDELVPVLGVRQQAARFGELGHEYRFALHPAEDHLSFTVKDEWSRETAWFGDHMTRVRNPRDVRLRIVPEAWGEAPLVPLFRSLVDEVGAQVDGGYWVSDVALADGAERAEVDLSSGGIARGVASTAPATPAPGIDGPSPYLLTGSDVAYGDVATDDMLRGTLFGVRSLTVDVGRAGLSDTPSGEFTTDGPIEITLVRDGEVVGVMSVPFAGEVEL